ncbi:hypothetical protein AtNW77_Chr1g0027661 [Arabidopsis thaliana]|uniref:At1g24575 n=4 Tax=Arabidopsis TaxID=3701 RepID=Q8LAL6_ARATH|nr:DEAD-box ATP-dependent RNA helicase-like protein [Arabidopsis thaliana]KAG7647459.1 hypothetical protein ISN45_At01g025010 [Arabidopsis thaliana x Arabidopsis arenosa]KAG7655417.1 hypothetical protein ISN44_As01g025000 [Arabidopsis suecica]AAM65275.1 unknown [Arabidopsis thaliana]AAV84502.1 At1g24575 [Arabidopsis thaliana]AAW38969.1 At1g24575 [Arabidopsis thaliana]|eukprot:NP_564220.1 DEAD-box ATP-dependent RNA helicase-like protein [Arabidopsis thaliana]
MVLGNSSSHKSHHHQHHNHHHRDSMKEFRAVFAAEEPIQGFEYADMRRSKSENMGTREVAKAEDVDKEAEQFIKFEHTKFSKWMTKSA